MANKKEERSHLVTFATSEEIKQWIEEIAERESRSISSVGHLALKRLKESVPSDQVTQIRR